MPESRRSGLVPVFLLAGLLLTSCVSLSVNTKNQPGSVPDRELTALDRYTAALQQMDEGKYREAERNLKDAIRDSREDPSFLYSELADCQRQLGNAATALSNYRYSLDLEPSRVSTRFKLADLYFSLNDITNAARTFESILTIDPKSSEALADLAALSEQTGDPDRAADFYRRLLDIDPSNLQAAANLLDMLVREREFDACLTTYSNLPEPLRRDYYVLMEKSYCQKQKGDYRGSLETLETARSVSGEPGEPYYGEKSEVLFFLDDKAGCLESLDQLAARTGPAGLKPVYQAMRSTLLGTDLTNALKQYNFNLIRSGRDLLSLYGKARLYLVLRVTNLAADQFILTGRAAFADGNLNLATNCLNQAKVLSPRNLALRILLAAVYDEVEKPESALVEIESAIRLSPTSFTLRQYKAELLEKSGRKTNAYKAMLEAISMGATNVDAFLKAGYLAADASRPAESVDWFQKAGNLKPGDPTLMTVIGLSLINAEKFDPAIGYFEKAVSLDPMIPKSRYYLAICYDKKGMTDEALTNIRMELAANPNDADSWNFLGYMLADHGLKLDEAVACVQRALAIAPDNPFYLDSLGWAYFKQKRFTESVEMLESAVLKLDQQKIEEPEVLEHLGDAYYALGHIDAAVKAWQRSLQIDNANPELKKKLLKIKKK